MAPRIVKKSHIPIRKGAPERTGKTLGERRAERVHPRGTEADLGGYVDRHYPVMASKPSATIIGTRIMANAIAPSPMPNTAPPNENRTNITGISKPSLFCSR